MVQVLFGSVIVQLALVVFACFSVVLTNKRQNALVKKLAQMEQQCRRHSHPEFSDLQTEVGQNLSCLSILLQVAEKYRQIKPEKADSAILQAKELTTASLNSIRQLKQLSENNDFAQERLNKIKN